MTPPNNDDLQRAWAWFDDHREHVLEIMKAEVGDAFPPNGPSCHKPELWRPQHWRWLFGSPWRVAPLGGTIPKLSSLMHTRRLPSPFPLILE
jgi:hypothetical protein